MDLREKVARAIRDFDDPGAEIAHQFAQAAIDTVFAELRNVTPGMTLRGWDLLADRSEDTDLPEVFLAMLDAAQKGE